MSTTTHPTKAALLALLATAPAQGIKVADMAVRLSVEKKTLYRLRRLLTTLLGQGIIERVSRGHYTLAEKSEAFLAETNTPVASARASQASKRTKTSGIRAADDTSATRRSHTSVTPGARERISNAQVSQTASESSDPALTGRLSVHPAGYGFVAVEDGSEDIFVPAKFRGTALDGDRVRLATWLGYKGTEGKVVKVLSRGRAKLTGTLQRAGRTLFLQPDDPRIASTYGHVSLLDGAPGGKVGQAALVEISRYPSQAVPEIFGRVTRILGDPDDPRTEIEKIILCADIPQAFPAAALAQADATPQALRPEDYADRIDLRDRPFTTIDPVTARDFDDALCVEDGPRGETRVWIAVADVSHYVRTDDPLDREAAVRGVSVYLPDRVLPMLPLPLSAGICSLNPEVDRCAMVVRIDYDDDANIVDTGFAAAVIRSHARLDYPGVAAALSGDFRGRRMHYRRWAPALSRLDRLAQKLRARRLQRGALELEISEAKVVLDNDDPMLVRNVVRAKGSDAVKSAYQLVEEFMIAANEAVGAFFRERELSALWRVHAPPVPSRLEDLATVLRSYGVRFDIDEAQTPRGMKEILQALEGTVGARYLSFLVLRSLTQAIYDPQPQGHFGLASPNYLHFTSPIRRYPDLIVHRLLKARLHREGHVSGGAASMRMPESNRIPEFASSVSQHERRALEAEREAVAMYRAYLMRDQLGDELTGTVSAATRYGAFVEIDEPFVEGLLKIDEIGDDSFVYHPESMRISGRNTGFSLQLGDRVLVRVANASVATRRVDLQLLSKEGKTPPTANSHGEGLGRRRRRKRSGR